MRARAIFQRFSENEWTSTLIVKPNQVDEGPKHRLALDITIENRYEPEVRIKASMEDLQTLLSAQVAVPLSRSLWTISIDGFPSFTVSQKQICQESYQDSIAEALEVWKHSIFTNRMQITEE